MSKAKSFIFAWALTTAILTANMFVRATEGQKNATQLGAASTGTVLVDGGKLSASLTMQDNEIQAILMATNSTDQAMTLNVNYQVQCMPPMSPWARMTPQAETRDSGTYSLTLAPGESAQKTIAIAPKGEQENLSESGTWTVVVSRDKIMQPMFGAGVPAVTADPIELTQGTAVLASLQLTVPDGIARLNAIR
jgi:hypothetical protein